MRGAIGYGVMAFLLVGAHSLSAQHAYQRKDPERRAHAEAWMREARRLGREAVIFPAKLKLYPDQVSTHWVAGTGQVLAVRQSPPPKVFPKPPSLNRILYFQPFHHRGPDQIPLPGQAFFERWVGHGGAALSTFSSRERFTFVSDKDVPAGDVLFGLSFVVGSARRAIRSTGGVLHLARLRAGRRQELAADFLKGLPTPHWQLEGDRRPVHEVLARDASASGLSMVVDEPLATRQVWAGGKAAPGAFTLAATQSLPASSARLGQVVGIVTNRVTKPPTRLGKRLPLWNRTGWAAPHSVLPADWYAHKEQRLWVHLREAPRDEARAMIAWVTRARRLGIKP